MPSWPWPRDSREDRAKRVALSYRHALAQLAAEDPAVAANLSAIDRRWSDLGAGWVQPTPIPLDLTQWLTAAEMAELFHQAPKTIYAWGYRGRIRVSLRDDGTRRYNVGDVVAYQRTRRLRR